MRSRVARHSRCGSCCSVCDALRDAVPEAVVAEGSVEVSLELVCPLAAVCPDVARSHVPDGTRPLVIAAFERAADDLLAEFQAGFDGAQAWLLAIEGALTRVLNRLAAKPAVAHLYLVAVLNADRDLLELRERRRERFVELLAVEYYGRAGSRETLPPLQFELVCGGIFRALAAFVDEGRLQEQTSGLVDELMRMVHVFEPATA